MPLAVTYLPRMSLKRGSRSIWYLSIYSNNSSVPRTFAIRTSWNRHRFLFTQHFLYCPFTFKITSFNIRIYSTIAWINSTLIWQQYLALSVVSKLKYSSIRILTHSCTTLKLETGCKFAISLINLVSALYLIIVVVAMKERFLAEYHTGKHATKTPHIEGVIVHLKTEKRHEVSLMSGVT